AVRRALRQEPELSLGRPGKGSAAAGAAIADRGPAGRDAAWPMAGPLVSLVQVCASGQGILTESKYRNCHREGPRTSVFASHPATRRSAGLGDWMATVNASRSSHSSAVLRAPR